MYLVDITVPPQKGSIPGNRISFLLFWINAAVHGQLVIFVTDPFVIFTFIREGRGAGEMPQFKDSPIMFVNN